MSSRLSSQLRWEPVPAASVARAGLRADARPVAADAGSKPIGHDPELAPRDEAVYLLHIAAEVEHALLAQYLYAVFSLRTSGLPDDRQKLVDAWRASILQIAKEEMAHLMTVQNLLRFIGGPITLDREDYPFRSDVYPFHFRLERLTKNSLAKYVFAESRDPADYPEAAEVKRRARLSDLDNPLNHVGAIYDAIRGRFKNSDPAQAMTAADVRPDAESVGYQAVFAEWSFRTPTGPNDGLINDDNLIIRRITSVDDAVKAIDDVALQGEGAPSSTPAAAGQEPSHFERFLAIFREFPEEGDWVPTYVVPNNPNTSAQPCAYEEMEDGRITNPRARRWAQLFNHRYRMLLTDLSHTLTVRRFLPSCGSSLCHRTRPGQRPRSPRSKSGCRTHCHSKAENRLSSARSHGAHVAGGTSSKERTQMKRFTRVKAILEEAVGVNDIGAHHNFWRNQKRDDFVALKVFGRSLLAKKADGSFDPDESNLVKALEARAPFGSDVGTPGATLPRMPKGLAPIPADSITFIRQWITDGCPDDPP